MFRSRRRRGSDLHPSHHGLGRPVFVDVLAKWNPTDRRRRRVVATATGASLLCVGTYSVPKPADKTNFASGYTKETLSSAADSALTTITFTSLDNSGYGAALGDVSVTPSPDLRRTGLWPLGSCFRWAETPQSQGIARRCYSVSRQIEFGISNGCPPLAAITFLAGIVFLAMLLPGWRTGHWTAL